jgi:prepilin-type N-terminal cleavage/methylation domain-containing protein
MNTLTARRRDGFTLIEILIVVAIMGIILGIALPAFLKSRTQARKQVCIENISQIESAKQQWGLENGKNEGDRPVDADIFGDNAYIKKKPNCPAGGVYDLMVVGTITTCTIEGHSL